LYDGRTEVMISSSDGRDDRNIGIYRKDEVIVTMQ
jgi:hypothetical protein